MALTKIQLVGLVQEGIGLTKKGCVTAVESLFEIMKDELVQGKAVMISGFGKWTIRSKHARKGRNPKTGKAITLPGRKVVLFKASNVLRKALSRQ